MSPRRKKKLWPLTDIPADVTEAAVKVATWFKERGIKTWELGDICSRDHAEVLDKITQLTDDDLAE